jgi:hypothetical protein
VLLDSLVKIILRYLILAAGAAEAMALWIIHTHAFEAATISPILGVVSPVRRCGKTQAIIVLTNLVRRPMPTSNITAAAMYRLIEKDQPTLLIDEGTRICRATTTYEAC